MRVTLLLLFLFMVAAPGCDRLTGEKDVTEAVDPGAAERVIERVLAELTESYRERGPLAAFELPRIKKDAVEACDFESWYAFQKRLLKKDPALTVEYSLRITARLEELGRGEHAEKPEEKAGAEETQEEEDE